MSDSGSYSYKIEALKQSARKNTRKNKNTGKNTGKNTIQPKSKQRILSRNHCKR